MKYSLIILLSFVFFACGNQTETDQSKGVETEAENIATKSTVEEVKVFENILKDPSLSEQGLISGLYGNWINEADAKDMMFFSGTDLVRIYDGKVKKIQQPAFFIKCPAGCDTNNSPEGNDKCIKVTNKDGSDECFVFEELTKTKMSFKKSGSEAINVFNKQK